MADSLFIVHFAGKALTFIKEKVLTWESGMRRGVPKVLVVVTDGRSQDEVRKAATVIQHSGKQFTVLAVSFLYVLSNAIISSKALEWSKLHNDPCGPHSTERKK